MELISTSDSSAKGNSQAVTQCQHGEVDKSTATIAPSLAEPKAHLDGAADESGLSDVLSPEAAPSKSPFLGEDPKPCVLDSKDLPNPRNAHASLITEKTSATPPALITSHANASPPRPPSVRAFKLKSPRDSPKRTLDQSTISEPEVEGQGNVSKRRRAPLGDITEQCVGNELDGAQERVTYTRKARSSAKSKLAVLATPSAKGLNDTDFFLTLEKAQVGISVTRLALFMSTHSHAFAFRCFV
jgi:hypothetical protein